MLFDYEIDWNQIQSEGIFNDLVSTLVLFEHLLDVTPIKMCHRRDLFHTIWHHDKNDHIRFYAIFASPHKTADEQRLFVEQKFNQECLPSIEKEHLTKLYLYHNTDSPVPAATNSEIVEVLGREEITQKINGNWKPAFRRFFKGGIPADSANLMNFAFLKDFGNSLSAEVNNLGIKEIENVISWLDDISYYIPEEMLNFCVKLHESKQTTEVEQHPAWGEVKHSRKDYLEKIQSLLYGVAAYIEYFDPALELLIRISLEINPISEKSIGPPHIFAEKIVGYYLPRDFIPQSGGESVKYRPDFNAKALDVFRKLIGEGVNDLTMRCLQLATELLKVKIDYIDWRDSDSTVQVHKFTIPLDDSSLSEVRQAAWRLFFDAYSRNVSVQIRIFILSQISDALRYPSISQEFSANFETLLEFLQEVKNTDSVPVLNKILDVLDVLNKADFEPIKSKTRNLKAELQDKFELLLCVGSAKVGHGRSFG